MAYVILFASSHIFYNKNKQVKFILMFYFTQYLMHIKYYY